MNTIKADSVIFLLGAGCSRDADIKTSNEMILEIESLINSDTTEWSAYRELYYYVKSAILYADGIQGIFENNVNIERLVGVLRDIKKKERNPIYPFIGNWNEKLLELAGEKFKNIDTFERKLSKRIVDFVTLDKETEKRVSYYKRFFDFQKEIESPIRIFSLNYDQCLEKAKPPECVLECGFGEDNIWSADRFITKSVSAGIYLYKLHGSIDWKRDKLKGNVLVKYDVPQPDADLIFGTDAKLQSVDPFLFNVYEFRYYSLLSKLIIIIGYSFNDLYINDLLEQALNNLSSRNLLIVDPYSHFTEETKIKEYILNKLSLDKQHSNQIVLERLGAKSFLETRLTREIISSYIKDEDDIF